MFRKTIFLELFSVASAPHFFAKGGVVSKLKSFKDVRTVLLIPEGGEFKDAASPYLGGNIEISEVTKTFPENFLQKAFVFFYSYLIFTGTTKMLATFGARADAPPAGGNRHLWWVKSLIAGSFGRSRFVKQTLVPFLYMKLFNTRPYRSLFDKYNPDLVFVTNIAFNPAIELLSEAKRRNIETMGMAANWDHLNKYYIPMHADKLLVQNDPMRQEAVSYHAYSPDQIELVGFPQFDPYNDLNYRLGREEYLKIMGIPSDHKVILYMSGSVYALDEADILEEIVSWIDSGVLGKATLMVRPYAGGRERKQEEEKYRHLFGRKNVVFNWRQGNDNIDNKKNYISMFAHADTVISVFSTTAIEAAIFDKPTITIGFDGRSKRPFHKSVRRLETLSHFKHVLDTGSVFVARDFQSLRDKITEYLKNPGLDSEKRKDLVDKMCYRVDGLSAQRVVDSITR